MMRKKTTMRKQIQRMLVGVVVPFIIMIIILFNLMMMFNEEYAASLENANTVAELNYEFKNNVDQATYQFIIRAKPVDEIPLDELNRVKVIIEKLKQSTKPGENSWRVEIMLNLIERLKASIIDIGNTVGYDLRIEKLNGNVHSITTLLQSYMHDYTYGEMKELAALQKQITERVSAIIGATILISSTFLAFVLLYAWHFSARLTEPIHQLCDKAKRLGEGDFEVVPITSSSEEIQTLDYRFNEMTNRIDVLLERVRDDQKALRKAELELLQSQINPHFLYNTFDSVVWLAETKQNEKVIQMVTSLSTFFRNSLSKGRDVISLEAEINQVASYLEIQQIRYFDILEYEIDVESAFKVHNIPKLTLQPLVENAIYHGIKNKRRKGKIRIFAEETQEEILIKIFDNGAGMTKDQLNSLEMGLLENTHGGLGLMNVSSRLKLHFGVEYGLKFESEYGESTTITVCIPKQQVEKS